MGSHGLAEAGAGADVGGGSSRLDPAGTVVGARARQVAVVMATGALDVTTHQGRDRGGENQSFVVVKRVDSISNALESPQ